MRSFNKKTARDLQLSPNSLVFVSTTFGNHSPFSPAFAFIVAN